MFEVRPSSRESFFCCKLYHCPCCREKEKGSSSARRSAEPAKANLLKLQTEVSDLNQQLAEAVQAAEAAEGRYRQARAQLRYALRQKELADCCHYP